MTTIDLEDPDLVLARQLQDQFDREAVEISSGEEEAANRSDHLLAVELQQRYNDEAFEVSDDDGDDVILAAEIPPIASGSGTARSPKRSFSVALEEEVNGDENSGPEVKIIRAKREDLNTDEYFIEDLQTYVDPENNFDWKFVEVMPNIKRIFARLDELFFQSRFKPKGFNVIWSHSIGQHCTNRNFNDVDGRYTIALNESLLTLRPRIEIISVLLHEMIHAYLKLENVQETNSGHGANFRKMMIFLNQMMQTTISFSHRLTNINTLCRTQWYRCTGICHNYNPFQGIVRSTEGDPGLQNEWWRAHAETCGGTFYKIYEMSRIVDGEVSTRYAVNVKYMKPKRENIRGRFKTRLPPKESIDLTSDQPLVIPTVTETVSLDDEGSSIEDTKAADKFIQCFNRSVALTRDTYDMQCPICQEKIKRKLFGDHIDGCKGIIEHINWKRPGARMVQDGILEHRTGLHMPYHPPSSDARPLGTSSTIGDYQRIKRQRFL
ncbi:uncharacterized protein LOC135699676 [Ochlerotatus camptorhynchus]|uniref:uncharacterized protein LOC135699676 n=1 Tax=Ochlerotatus camptorhynchus TaxID=644619 RepID=UPI0031DBF9AD